LFKLTGWGGFKYASISTYRHEQRYRNHSATELDTWRLDRTCCSDSDSTRYRLPFFIEWLRRPKLKFLRAFVEETNVSEGRKEYTVFLQLQNQGKVRARNCQAHFESKSPPDRRSSADLPRWGLLDWIYEDGHRATVGSLSYLWQVNLELIKFTVTQIPYEYQIGYEYTVDGKFVARHVEPQYDQTVIEEPPVKPRPRFRVGLTMISLGIYDVMVDGDYSLGHVSAHARLVLTLKDEPRIDSLTQL